MLWPAPFAPFEYLEDRSAFEAELRREVKPGHALFGVPVAALARRYDQADVLFELLDLVIRSGIYQPADFDQKVALIARLPADPQRAANLLVESGILTKFQARHIMAGKYKGFKVTKAQVKEIAKRKFVDLNARDEEHAMRIVEGTARSMGLTVE